MRIYDFLSRQPPLTSNEHITLLCIVKNVVVTEDESCGSTMVRCVVLPLNATRILKNKQSTLGTGEQTMKLNREQIIKALECCRNDETSHCRECPYYEGTLDCMGRMSADALALIKELAQANEQLSESYDHLEKTKNELLAERSRLTEENERLRAELDRTEKALTTLDKAHNALFTDTFRIEAEVKADTVRKMQNAMAVHFGTYTDKDTVKVLDVVRLIEQIADKMLEGGTDGNIGD